MNTGNENETNSRKSNSAAMRRAFIAIVVVIVLAAAFFWIDPAGLYPWVKAVHIIAVIAWMAGMLYLPRLFVYHADTLTGSQQSETFKVMERRLLRVIINPAMIAVWVLGLWMAWTRFGFSGSWLHAKIALVIALSGMHGHFAKAVRLFAEDRNKKSARYWRIMNEVPTLLMIGIVILVVVKPF